MVAQAVGTIDIADVVSGKVDDAKSVISSGLFRVVVYALPRASLRIRARRRIIELSEGSLSRLEYAAILVHGRARSSGRSPSFKEFAEVAGDYKAAAVYMAFLWRSGLISFEDDKKALDLYIAANSLSQKTYEHRLARVLDSVFNINMQAFRSLNSTSVACAQRNGLVLCRYAVARPLRSQAKAQVRALLDLTGYKPA
ncbi:MAG: hypothetical protein DSY37_01960 [Hyperthermus sp.]|nr:MAG: hypothetical protein DSY37_01960 [Hyperthermus sp.]